MVDTIGMQSRNTTALRPYIGSSSSPAAWVLDLEIHSAAAHCVTSNLPSPTGSVVFPVLHL